VKAIVFHHRPGDRYRAGRTMRALRAAGIHAVDAADGLAAALAQCAGPAWLVGSGAWPVAAPAAPPSSGSGRALCALGAVYEADGRSLTRGWGLMLGESGGDLEDWREALPELRSVYLDAALVGVMRDARWADEGSLERLVIRAVRECNARFVRWRALDVADDPRLRIAEVVTSLQIGGAERVVLDLAESLPRMGRFGFHVPLIVTGRALREAFDAPEGTTDVSAADGGREGRMAAAARAACAMHVDAAHVHLLGGNDLEPFRAAGLPVMITLHNLRQGWPPGVETFGPRSVDLLVSCAQAVEADASGMEIPVRTAWNGIDGRALEWTPALGAAARELRASWGVGEGEWVVLAVANPRPQKRLESLPAIMEALRARLMARGEPRHTCLVIAGQAAEGLADAEAADALLKAELQRYGTRVRRIGAVRDIGPLLHAADVLVSASAWEGLSLAQMEALAAGLPVVATDVGGTRELAAASRGIHLVGAEADAETFAAAIIDAIAQQANPAPQLGADFRRERMAERYAQLLPRSIERGRMKVGEIREGRGIWLVTNNFSIGGAQSSARRLLRGLQERGVAVRAAVVQEEIEHLTPGRRALESAGVKVIALEPPPPLGVSDPALAVETLLEAIDSDPPEAVVFWNLITQYKVLLADLLIGTKVVDVSPGEMNFSSLEKYFASPRPGLPYRDARAYGARLSGVVVKYAAERGAAEALGAPVHIIPNGVAVAETYFARPQKRPGERIVMGTAVRLSPQKRLEELFAALRRARDLGLGSSWVLRVAGGPDGDNHDYAATLRQSTGDLPVEWAGEVADMEAFLRELDLFLMISEPAGCPNASLEAMAAGLPLVVTDVGGAREQVEDRVNGRLVPRGDVEALAGAIVEAAGDAALRSLWGYASWQRARERFSANRMVDDYRELLLGPRL
jgi:glycosyltransferase involved in cell wall biosynthesis